MTISFCSGIAPARLLLGLRTYHSPTAADRLTSSKKNKDDIDLYGAENLLTAPATASDWLRTRYFDTFDFVLFLLHLTLVSLAFAALPILFGGVYCTVLPLILCVTTIVMSISALARVDILSQLTSGVDKVYGVAFGILCFIIALAVVEHVAPRGTIFVWNVDQATASFGPFIQSLEIIKKVEKRSGAPIPSIILSPWLLRAVLALAAGGMGTLLFSPALRFVRGYWLSQSVPEWAEAHIKVSHLSSLLLHMHMLVVPVSSLVWAKPLALDDFMPHDAIPWVRKCLMTMAGVLFILNTGTLVQRYLDTALMSWHHLKHGSSKVKKDRDSAGKLIRIKCLVVQQLKGKAAVQTIMPGVILLAFGIIMFLAGNMEGPGSIIVSNIAGFCAWWMTTVWSVLVGIDLWLFRTGVLTN